MTLPRSSPSPVSCTLDLIGDRWTLLIIRDMIFFDEQRFEEFWSRQKGSPLEHLMFRIGTMLLIWDDNRRYLDDTDRLISSIIYECNFDIQAKNYLQTE